MMENLCEECIKKSVCRHVHHLEAIKEITHDVFVVEITECKERLIEGS